MVFWVAIVPEFLKMSPIRTASYLETIGTIFILIGPITNLKLGIHYNLFTEHVIIQHNSDLILAPGCVSTSVDWSKFGSNCFRELT